jgi:hypothetical protein
MFMNYSCNALAEAFMILQEEYNKLSTNPFSLVTMHLANDKTVKLTNEFFLALSQICQQTEAYLKTNIDIVSSKNGLQPEEVHQICTTMCNRCLAGLDAIRECNTADEPLETMISQDYINRIETIFFDIENSICQNLNETNKIYHRQVIYFNKEFKNLYTKGKPPEKEAKMILDAIDFNKSLVERNITIIENIVNQGAFWNPNAKEKGLQEVKALANRFLHYSEKVPFWLTLGSLFISGEPKIPPALDPTGLVLHKVHGSVLVQPIEKIIASKEQKQAINSLLLPLSMVPIGATHEAASAILLLETRNNNLKLGIVED